MNTNIHETVLASDAADFFLNLNDEQAGEVITFSAC